jgi:putative intracellular protease/amidase
MEDPMRDVFLYVHEGFADWEPAFVLPELRRAGYRVRAVAGTAEAAVSAGGLRIVPSLTLDELHDDDVEILILPGGDSWQDPARHEALLARLPAMRARRIPIAAVCAATVPLARLGMLDEIAHTSNDLGYLSALAPTYRGASRYSKRLAVTDDRVVTASGIGALEFAFEIMTLLDVQDRAWRGEWFELMKHAVIPAWLAA